MLDMHHLETLRVLAMTRNFTKAAIVLQCSQSSVTTHIQALEKELGAQLFERSRFSKSVTLTRAGRCALEYGQKLMALANEAIAAAGRAGRDSGDRPQV